MVVSERPPTSRGEYYFSLGWIRYYRYRAHNRESLRGRRAAPSASAAVVRSRVENSGEKAAVMVVETVRGINILRVYVPSSIARFLHN